MKSLLTLVLWLPLCLFSEFSEAANYTVIIEAMKFVPAELSVKAGDKITWVNKDFFPHTATTMKPGFNSKYIPASKSWVYSPKRKGDFPYKCMLHPTMKGLLVVQ